MCWNILKINRTIRKGKSVKMKKSFNIIIGCIFIFVGAFVLFQYSFHFREALVSAATILEKGDFRLYVENK